MSKELPTMEALHDQLAQGVELILERGGNRVEVEKMLVELATDVRHHRPLRKYSEPTPEED